MNSRRNFLKIAGASLSGSVLQPFTARGGTLNTRGQTVRIGVLMPQSNRHPHYPGSFLSGFRSGIDRNKALRKEKVELITEQVNFGTPVIAREKINKLMSENSVNLITGILNTEVAGHVSELLRNARLPAVIANAGENYPVGEVQSNRYLFINSLNLYQSAYHTGRYAVEQFGKRVAVVTSFYESGYDALFTFRQGVERAGGTLEETIITSTGQDGVATAAEQLAALQPDAAYLFMNGDSADDVIRTLYHRGSAIPLLTTAFAVEEQRLVQLGEAAKNIISIGSWSRQMANPENRQFVSAFQKQSNRAPDLFSLLGYETGLIAYDALMRCNGDYSGERLTEALQSCSIQSPRGAVSMHKDTGITHNRLCVNRVVMNSLGIPENEVIDSFEPVFEQEEQFALLDNNYRSGWLNPYLFV